MESKNKKRKVEWIRLDNASKIFPATSSNKDTKVYRISAELYNNIEPENLQKALDLTMDSFPMYKSILRRGFFWYCLEMSDIYPKVEIESTNPCSPIYREGKKNLLFRISYYKKRINFEIFHVLSDGAGAVWFLETLVFYYIKINYEYELGNKTPTLEYRASISQKMDDSFWKNYTSNIQDTKINKEKHRVAYTIKGKRIDENKMKVIEGAMSVKDVLSISKEYGTSLTVFVTSLLIQSIYLDMPKNKNKKPIVISVPINLRSYYNSSTARNFFTTLKVCYNFKDWSSNLKDIVDYVDKEFEKGLEKESINRKLIKFMELENKLIARILPLTIKDIVMKIADKINDRSISSSVSNIGKLKTPKEFNRYLKQFSICVSAKSPKITFCSYNDRLVITFTSPYMETDIQRMFFQFLSSKDVKIEITSNM